MEFDTIYKHMANMEKWLTHLAVNQACTGSNPVIRPIRVKYSQYQNIGCFFLYIGINTANIYDFIGILALEIEKVVDISITIIYI